MGIGELRMIHSRVVWMSLPVERSMRVSAPHFAAHWSFSTSSAIELVTAELPMFALILTRNALPMIIGSDSGWLMFDGMIARPAATSERTSSTSHCSRIAT
ncbi:Uncharacterised protein [Mycobacteroides abscessus subsp. abscessus]|nr:Uncharacterised protein [Mycobacteroides abscessus subsp. abscessus]